MGLGALLEADDPDAAHRRASAASSAGKEVDRTGRALERDAVRRLLTRLERLKRELQGVILAAGGDGFRAFTAQSLIVDIDRLIAGAREDITADVSGTYTSAERIGTAAVDEPLKGARIAVASAAPGLDLVLAQRAFDTTADLLTEPMQVFRNKVVQGVRRAAIAGSASFDELRKLAVSIDTAGMDAAKFKAERIVRTELGRVFTGSTFDRMLNLEKDFPFIRKGWRAARDGRTRQGHLDAHATYARGSGIRIQDRFKINVYQESPGKPPKLLGVALLRYALDPEAEPKGRLAAGATILCRCNNFVDFNLAELRAYSTKRSLAVSPGAPAPVLIPGTPVPVPEPTPRARKVKTTAAPKTNIKAPALPKTTSGDPHLAEPLTGPGRRYGINERWLGAASKNAAEKIREDLAIDLGRPATLEELKAHVDKLDKHVADLVKKSDVYSRTTPAGLNGILNSGRFKSQFETATSQGMLDPRYRATVENKMWGLPEDLDVTKRPIYGYLSESGTGGYSTSSYGEIVIKFKPDVRDRSTFTFGDSFGTYGNGDTENVATAPAPVSAPRAWAWPWQRPTGNRAPGGRADTLLRSPHVDRPGELPYTEAQIFGGVSTKDIERVILPRGSYGSPRAEIVDLTEKLDKAGIPWKLDGEDD